jgi:hypothetical protein
MSTPSTAAPSTPVATAGKSGGWALAAKLAAYEAAAGILYGFALKAGFMDFALPFIKILFLIPLVAWALEAFPNPWTEKGLKVLLQLFIAGAVLTATPLILSQIHYMFWTVDNDLGDTMDKTKTGLALKLSTQIEQEMVGPGLELMKEKNAIEGVIARKLAGEFATARADFESGKLEQKDFIAKEQKILESYDTLTGAADKSGFLGLSPEMIRGYAIGGVVLLLAVLLIRKG